MRLGENNHKRPQETHKIYYINFFELNLNSFSKVWNTLDAQKLIAVSDNNIYVVCLESIDNDSALFLDNALRNGSSYLEAVGVNEAS